MSNSTNTETVTSIWKPIPVVATIDIQDDEFVVTLIDENEATLTEDKTRHPLQCTSSEE